MSRRNTSRGSSNRQWNAYSPPDSSGNASASGSRGQPSFFYYNPEGSSQSQWWYNTFAEGQEQQLPPPPQYHNPYPFPYYSGYQYTPQTIEPIEFEPPLQRPRSRTPTPPPPQSPSPEYLATSDEPSTPIAEPHQSRKLLVLDLNGTLLHRSPHVPRGKSRAKKPDDAPQSPPLPRLRPVHPRPYLPSFRSYLFHPHTKSWLDVMIWSSAQPHSVSDMVQKCFGDTQAELSAIWARDTLGLTSDHYYRKVQTTKDLNTPWRELFALPLTDGGPGVSIHSARTTVLMDDSHAKAALQPFNHLCVREYAAEVRAADLAALQAEKLAALAPEPEPEPVLAVPMPMPEHVDPVLLFGGTMGIQPDATLLQPPPPADDNAIPGLIFSDPLKQTEQAQALALLHEQQASSPPGKKRKRKSKKHAQVQEGPPVDIKYDETLLAIVGILHTLKGQSNVAAWVKAGGLWGPIPPPAQVRTEEVSPGADADGVHDGKRQRRDSVATPDGTGNDAAATATTVEQGDAGGAPMWFESGETVEHWVRVGRDALEGLGIPIVHGLER